MPPKKRAGRTIPKPTIMLEANLPPDLPAPTTTRNRQPRAQTTLSFRTTRQSTSRSEIKSPVTSQTRSAMQRTASPSNEGTTDGRSIQDADSLRGSRSYQQDEDGLIVDERTGHAPLLDDVESDSAGPSSTGYLTPLSDTLEHQEYAYNDGHGQATSVAPGPSSLRAAASTHAQHLSAGVSSSPYISGAKRKRFESESLNDGAEEPPESQDSVGKIDKGKGKARNMSQIVDEDTIEISDSPVKPSPPSQDASGQGSSISVKKGKGKARATSASLNSAIDDSNVLEISDSPVKPQPPYSPPKATQPTGEPLSSYTCPICFGAPTNATLTPCGHICCGACLFAAVKATMSRSSLTGPMGPGGRPEARCPVCRAIIPNWDGKGRGVIGLQIRASFNV